MKCPICQQTVTPSHFACHSGAKGGQVSTEAKAAAARANGTKGGRPRKPALASAKARAEKGKEKEL